MNNPYIEIVVFHLKIKSFHEDILSIFILFYLFYLNYLKIILLVIECNKLS